MHKLTFYPLGNADCCRIDLADGRKVLKDYANMRNADDPDEKRCDLPSLLRQDLRESRKAGFDVLAISHLDDDHFHGMSEFFELRHAKKYRGGDRVPFDEMWVPAAIVTEPDKSDEALLVQKEARHRLREGYGVRVFSRPKRLKDWLKKNGLTLEERRHLITDAGQLVPGYDAGGVEFFVHSPFATRQDDNEVVQRNDDALVLHVTLTSGHRQSRVFLAADVPHEVLTDIVAVTEARGNGERLEWDINKLSHHCSYKSLGPRGDDGKVVPAANVERLFEDYGRPRSYVVSTSKPIPLPNTPEDKDVQPPHRDAADYYKRVARGHGGSFVVTMEHPSETTPRPMTFHLDEYGVTLKKVRSSGAAGVVTVPAPRAG